MSEIAAKYGIVYEGGNVSFDSASFNKKSKLSVKTIPTHAPSLGGKINPNNTTSNDISVFSLCG